MNNDRVISTLLEELEELLKRATEIRGQIQNLVRSDSSSPRTNLYLHVTIHDGKQICYPICVRTYIEVIELLGTEKVYRAVVALGIRWRNFPIVDPGHDNESHWHPSGEYGIYKGGNTPQKADNLKDIVEYLKIPIQVKVLDEAEYQEYSRSGHLNLTKDPKRITR